MRSLYPLAVAFAILSAGPARAGSGDRKSALQKLEEGDAVRARVQLKGGRFEAAPALGFTLNDAFQRTVLFGVQLNYHISESWALGATIFGGAGLDTGLAENVDTKRPEKVKDGSFANVGLIGSLDLYYTPLFGKFALFGRSVLAYDLHTVIGVGGTQVSGSKELDSFSPAPVLGIGLRTFVNNWMSLNIEVRDYIYSAAINAVTETDSAGQKKIDAESEISNNFALIFAFGFYFPQEPEIGR